jgi:Protein of unknown function (DUF3137)
VTAGPVLDIATLERRRRLAFRAAAIALLVAVFGFKLGTMIGGSENRDTIGGAFLFAAIIGIVAAPWIVRAWQSFMRRKMIAAAVAGRPEIRHIDGEKQQAASAQALASDAFSLAAFRDSGLIERFESAGVDHILTGDARGVPFAIAEISLLDAKGYRMFGGVLASFRLARPRPGLTIVMRDRGILGNLLERAGSGIERLPLEDPEFEGVFEVYGTDQVGGRVILTTTMLERLKALDHLAHAHGFACAFLEEHLLIAFRGMSWRCPSWRIVKPVDTWLQEYATWLAGLVDLPVDIVHTLNLAALAAAPGTPAAPFVPTRRAAVSVGTSTGQVFSSGLWRLVGEGGMAFANIASGALFGFVALFGAWYGIKQGYASNTFWYFWGMISAGIAYGVYAIAIGVIEIARLAWRWNAPLRTLKRP